MLYHTTEMLRTSVPQELREILPAVQEAPPGSHREVQILVPSSPSVYAVVTPDPRYRVAKFPDGRRHIISAKEAKYIPSAQPGPQMAMDHALGADRTYKGILLPTNAQITIRLQPEQAIWAASEQGYAEMGLIIEYRSAP